jgi:uncharacterized membrane protein (UPF0127 family)
MFSQKKNLIFVFRKKMRVSLHMLFVFFPIWVLYLDDKKRLLYKKKLYPFISTCYPKQKARYVVEIVDEPHCKIGDIVSW